MPRRRKADSKLRQTREALDRVIRGLRHAETFPSRLIVRVHDSIMLSEDLPMYTGTYAGAIREEYGQDGKRAIVYMSVESLVASAAEHLQEWEGGAEGDEGGQVDPMFYAHAQAEPEKAEPGDWGLEPGFEPYPLRLERIGSPSYDKGAGLWTQATIDAAMLFLREAETIEALLTGKRTI